MSDGTDPSTSLCVWVAPIGSPLSGTFGIPSSRSAAVIKPRHTVRACPNLRPISHTPDPYASVGRRLKTAAGTMLRRITTSGRSSVPNVATRAALRTTSTNRRNFSAVPMTANMLPTVP